LGIRSGDGHQPHRAPAFGGLRLRGAARLIVQGGEQSAHIFHRAHVQATGGRIRGRPARGGHDCGFGQGHFPGDVRGMQIGQAVSGHDQGLEIARGKRLLLLAGPAQLGDEPAVAGDQRRHGQGARGEPGQKAQGIGQGRLALRRLCRQPAGQGRKKGGRPGGPVRAGLAGGHGQVEGRRRAETFVDDGRRFPGQAAGRAQPGHEAGHVVGVERQGQPRSVR